MAETWWESAKMSGAESLDQVRRLLHEGNVRRIIIKQDDRVVAEFPLMIGVVGAVFAPVLAAVGAMAALITDCTIVVEREGPAPAAATESAATAASEAASNAAAEGGGAPAKDVGSVQE